MAYNMPMPNYQPPLYGSGNNAALQLIMQLVGQQQGATNEARQANESRYQDILSLLGNNRQRTLGSLDTLSGQQVADANKQYTDMKNELVGKLPWGASRNIPIDTATQRERDAAVNRIRDTQLQNRNAADLGFTDRATGVMERRSDPYPQNQNIGAIIQQLSPYLGGALGGGFNGGNGGNSRNPGRTAIAPLAAQRGMVNQQANQQGAFVQPASSQQNATYDEQQRRNAMTQLSNALANERGGDTNVHQALAYLQQNGWAEQNPRAAVGGNVPAQLTQYQNYPQHQQPTYYGSGVSSPTPQYHQPTADYVSPQQSRFDDIQRRRQAWMNGPTMQASQWAAGNGFGGTVGG